MSDPIVMVQAFAELRYGVVAASALLRSLAAPLSTVPPAPVHDWEAPAF